jgi:hypothetical protein
MIPNLMDWLAAQMAAPVNGITRKTQTPSQAQHLAINGQLLGATSSNFVPR